MNCSNPIILALCAAIVASSNGARAEDLGVIGPVYPIGEESALDTILNKLKAKERSGELNAIQDAAF